MRAVAEQERRLARGSSQVPDSSNRIPSVLRGLEFRLLEVSLAALLIMNGVSIFSRYVLKNAVGELFEVMILLGVATYWLGIATAERLGGHIGMDLFVAALPRRGRLLADIVRKVVILGFLAVVIYSGVRLSISQYRFGTSSGLMDLPLWIFSMFMPIGCALLAWRTIFPPRRPDMQTGPTL